MNCESSDAILQTYITPSGNSSGENCTEASEDESENDNFGDNEDLYKGDSFEDNGALSNDYIIKKEDDDDVDVSFKEFYKCIKV